MAQINNRDFLYKKTIVSPIDVIGVLDDDFETNPLLVIHKIVAKYIKKISDGCINKRIVDGFYTVLCYEYNLTIGCPETVQLVDFDQTLFNTIIKFIYENYDNEGKELIPVLYEIIVLHLKLYFTISTINELFKNFLVVNKNHNNDNHDIYHKVIECFVDVLCLKHAPDQQEIAEAGLPILEEMINWYKTIQIRDWVLFVTIITKMVKAIEKRIALDYLWVMILNFPANDWEKSLALLNVVIDDVLALSSEEKISVNYNCCRSEMLWQLILQGLMSPLEQNHKLGLHSMKRALNFLEKFQLMANQISNIVPFICCPNYRSNLAVKHAINFFFLLMESLEEGQGNLVHQTVAQLDILVQFHNFHCLFCFNCLDLIWLECIFRRVLTHKTTEVVKMGVIALVKLDPKFYYDDLVILLINTLNNAAIHDSETFSLEPQIIKELSELFVKAEYSQVSLVKKFICHAAQVTWAPIPLFYVLYCLCKAGYMVNYPVQCNRFEEEELKCLQVIVEKNLNVQLSVLTNVFCQNIIDIINLYAWVSDAATFDLLSKIYMAFETSSSCHELIVNSLRNKITIEQAAQYISEQCAKLSKHLIKRKPENVIDLEQFAKMIVYLFDASLIFRASNAPELKAMCAIFNSIIVDESQQQYVDKIHHTKILELLNYFFMGLNKVCGIDKLNFIINSFMAVLESVLVSVVTTFERPIIYSYKEFAIYSQTFQTISDLIISKVEDYRGYFTKVLAEAERVIQSVSNNEYKDIKFLFALKLQHTCIKYLEKYNIVTLKLLMNAVIHPMKFRGSNGEEVKMTTECYDLLARSIVQTIKFVPNNSPFRISEPVRSIQRLLILEKEQVMPSAIELMTKSLYLTCIDNYGNIIEPFFELVWNALWTMEQNETFFKCYDLFADFSFLIVGFKIAENLRNEGVKYIKAMYEKGKNIPRLKRLIIKKLIAVEEDSFVFFQSIIVRTLIHVEEEDAMVQRLEAQVQFFAFNNSDPERRTLAAVDMTSRARLVLMLCSMLRQGKGIGLKDIVGLLMVELEERKNKHDLNSDRVKCRVMQVLMVLQPYLNQDRAMQIIAVISESIVSEKVTLIVRTLQEWLLIKIFLMYGKLLDELWRLFERTKYNLDSIISVALIINHVAMNALPKSQALLFIKNAISKLEFFLHNQEFYGHYCQIVIMRLIRLLPPNLNNYYKDIKKTIETNLIISEHATQLAQDFRLNKFHPHKNYTIKTIFYDLPRLMNGYKNEWILPSILDYENTVMIAKSSVIKISNVCTLENVQAMETSQIVTHEPDRKNANNDNDVEIVELE